MLTPTLLTALKIAAPVGTIASMGGVVYIVANNTTKKVNDFDAIYLLVKGKTQASPSANKVLAEGQSTNTTKNYFCQSIVEGNQKIEDKNCGLYKLNLLSTASKPLVSIDFHKNTFTNYLLEKEAGSIKATSHHILKVSKSFYASFKDIKTTDKEIKLVDKTNASNHLGIVTELLNLDIKERSDLVNLKTNLFLARIKTPGTSLSSPLPTSLTCKLSDDITVDCKIFALSTADKAKTNDLAKEDLSNLKAITTSPSTDLVAGNYIVVELKNSKIQVSDLKNKTLTINKVPAAGSQLAATDKVADVIFDQVLIGQVNASTPASSIVFPITPKKSTFVVKKTTGDSNAFTDIKSTGTKNFKCKFTFESHENFDNSCEIKVFPNTPKVHLHSSMYAQSTGYVGIEASTNSADVYLLTVDSNKLFNLKPDWTKPEAVNVVAIVDDQANKSTSMTIQQEIRPKKSLGKTNMALVKYKSKTSVTGSLLPATGKCFFSNEDKDGFVCSFKKVTPKPNGVIKYVDLEFESTDSSTFAEGDTYALVTTTMRDIKDFDAKTINFHHTASAAHSKYTFDIIAAMGGSVDSGKIAYYLEAPRSISNT